MGIIGKIVDVILTKLEQAKSENAKPSQEEIVMRDQLIDSENRIANLKRDLARERDYLARLKGAL